MLGDTFVIELEARCALLYPKSANFSQVSLHRLYNLLIRNGQPELLARDVHHSVGEEQIRPDAAALPGVRIEINETIVDNTGEQTAHLAQLMICKNQFVVTQLGQDGIQLARIPCREN